MELGELLETLEVDGQFLDPVPHLVGFAFAAFGLGRAATAKAKENIEEI